MVFSSTDFLLLFLPAFLLCYFVGGRAANPVLLVFSLLFYAVGESGHALVMVSSIGFNWAIGLAIAAAAGWRRRLWLGIGVGGNLALLGWFKYLGFLATEVLGLDPAEAGFAATVHLPLGISFFTFQAISYLVDLARGDCRVERSPFRLGSYIAMFPQLVAGPIVRFASVAEALRARTVTPAHLYHGLGFFALGLAAKVLIADGVAPVADALFGTDPARLRADAAVLAVVAYTLQIYFDFLGYSLMAVGLGAAIGFRFPRNFDHPYSARSVTEFWRRWHISLSTWFRDYLYIPLGGNRHGPLRTYLNLWTVFLLTGLWHGASWSFVAWGAFHGAFLVVERLGAGRLLARLPGAVGTVWTLAAVMAGWVLFRADSLAGATGMFAALGRWAAPVTAGSQLTTEVWLTLAAGVLLAGPRIGRALGRVVAMPALDAAASLRAGAVAAGLALWLALVAASLVKVLSGGYSPFIYFRF